MRRFFLTGLMALATVLWPTAGVVADAVGDFNGDGRGDLAVGVPGEAVGTTGFAGAVNVLYGRPSGLSAFVDQFWHQDSPDVMDTAERADVFGSALAVGDFNGNGRADLAVGAADYSRGCLGFCPAAEDVGPVVNAGAVNVIYGDASGLSTAGGSAVGQQFWFQSALLRLDGMEADDGFGSALAAGDFNGDGRDDLAVGVPGEDTGATSTHKLDFVNAPGRHPIWHCRRPLRKSQPGLGTRLSGQSRRN